MNRFSIALAALALGAGCSPQYYSPNVQNVPGITAKGQGHAGLTGNGSIMELQGSYGITDALAILLNGLATFVPDKSNGDGGSGRFIEGGLGYFHSLSDKLTLDAFGLVGVGKVENHFPSTVAANPNTSGEVKASILRLGVQPSVTYRFSPFVSVIGSARAARLVYSNFEGSLRFAGVNQIDYLVENSSSFLIEPALTVRAGPERIKFQAQYVRSFNLSVGSFRQAKDVVSFGVMFGL